MLPGTLNAALYRRALRSLRGGLTAVVLLSAAISVLMLTGSIYMLQVYDRVLNSGSVPTLIALFAIVVMLYGFLAFYDGLRMRLLSRLSLQFDNALAPLAFHRDLISFRTPDQHGRAGRQIEVIRSFLGSPAILAVFDLPFTILFLGVLFLIHPVLGWMTVMGMVLAGGLALINRAVLKAPMVTARAAEDEQMRFAEGVRQSASVFAALGMVNAVTQRWRGLHHTVLGLQQKGTEPSENLSALSRALRMLLQSALLTAGAWLVIDGAMSAGAIVAASILSGRALMPVDQLIGHWRHIAALREAHDGLSNMTQSSDAGVVVALPPLTGAIEIEHLTRLAPARPGSRLERAKILDGVSFSVAPGEGLGIVGASGSGKSTLARLIVGAASPDAGEVRFDGAAARHWESDRLGRQIGYLPQRIDLLPGTLRDNIARFDATATDEAVIRAAKAAGIHETILRLTEGYGTDLGQTETPLSGGQIQRIGLARALFGEPRILVLDEPNAHLDQAGEAALSRCLLDLRAAGVTVIVLAHRVGALAAVDRLMVLQEGRIVQDGPRDEVLTLLGSASRGSSKPPRLADGIKIRTGDRAARQILVPTDEASAPSSEIFADAVDTPIPPVAASVATHPLFRSRLRQRDN